VRASRVWQEADSGAKGSDALPERTTGLGKLPEARRPTLTPSNRQTVKPSNRQTINSYCPVMLNVFDVASTPAPNSGAEAVIVYPPDLLMT